MTPHPARPAKPWRDPNPDELAAQVGAAWEALPDDIDPADTLADAIADLVAQRDKARREREATDRIVTTVVDASGWAYRRDPRPLSVSDLIVAPRIDRTRPQHPQLRIWNGEPWVDPRDLLWHDELDAAVARHPAGKARP